MALITCKDCQKEFSTDAKRCPHCGAKRPTKTLQLFLIFLLLIFVLPPVIRALGGNSASTASHTVQQTASSDTAAAPVQSPPPEQWVYRTEKDTMTQKDIWSATVVSNNSIELDFPYAGPQTATLEVRRHPQYGKDIIFQIERGQILCEPFHGCSVLVRFDDQPAERYAAGPPADHSTTVLFIKNYDKFVQRAIKAKKVFIQVSIYQNGNQTLEFNVAGLNPNKTDH